MKAMFASCSSRLRRSPLPLILLPALFGLASSPAQAIPFPEADIFFEFNSTPRDLGVHVSLDAESWKQLRIQAPNGQAIIDVSPRGNLGRVGLTELFFEGEEPSLVEVPFREFLKKVPAGTYTFLGTTTENQPLRSTDRLTTDIPCPVPILTPREGEEVPANDLIVRWRANPGVYNPDTQRCDATKEVELVGYQVIVEITNEARGINRHLIADLPASSRQLSITPGFIRDDAQLQGTEFLIEVLAIADSGNKTMTARHCKVQSP